MAVFVDPDKLPWERWNGAAPPGDAGVQWKLLLSGDRTSSQQLCAGLAELAPGEVLPSHRHGPAELYFVLDGEGRCEVDDIGHPLRAGTALFIPGGAWHRTSNTGQEPLRYLFVLPADSIRDVEHQFRGQDEEVEAAPPNAHRRTETDPELNNADSTPGTGMLPELGSNDPNSQPSS
ncbi:cupin domain-containing protein [Chelativorans sp.]|uniref:cupin domain-containing protein n=1 Tax=Chelativorans sp. TaxID=2203393 RepID=UPI00281266E8|nr:cupin domain-containing protein [Chelativorans sp.]